MDVMGTAILLVVAVAWPLAAALAIRSAARQLTELSAHQATENRMVLERITEPLLRTTAQMGAVVDAYVRRSEPPALPGALGGGEPLRSAPLRQSPMRPDHEFVDDGGVE